MQTLAHHPLEVVPQVSVYGEYVVGSLMVSHEDIGALAVDEVSVLNLYPHAKEEAHRPRPPLGWVIAPIVTIKQASHNRDNACDDGEHEQDRRCDAIVIDSSE